MPTYALKRRWSDRMKVFDQPLFPGYLFCKLDPRVRIPLLTTPGVISIVGPGNQPIPIPDGEIDTVRGLSIRPLPSSRGRTEARRKSDHFGLPAARRRGHSGIG